jgi:hypothetical protein
MPAPLPAPWAPTRFQPLAATGGQTALPGGQTTLPGGKTAPGIETGGQTTLPSG